MCRSKDKYNKPPELPLGEVEALVEQYRLDQSNGLKPKNIPRCRLRACSCRVKLENYVQGHIFCSDECIKIFNKKIDLTEYRRKIRSKEFRPRCKECNKYLKAAEVESGFCDNRCMRRYKSRPKVEKYILMLKSRKKKHDNCAQCNGVIPYSRYRNLVQTTKVIYCSDYCYYRSNIINSTRKNEKKYNVFCVKCGVDFVATTKGRTHCIDCSQNTIHLDFDMAFMDAGVSYVLGIMYNAGYHNYYEVVICSRLEVCEYIKKLMGVPTDIYTNWLDGSDEMSMYYLRIPSIPLMKVMYILGHREDYLRMEMPNIDDCYLPYFYDGLMFSTWGFYDLGIKYYPMINEVICKNISNYKGIPMCYKNGLWCLYESVDNIDRTNYDDEYDNLIFGDDI